MGRGGREEGGSAGPDYDENAQSLFEHCFSAWSAQNFPVSVYDVDARNFLWVPEPNLCRRWGCPHFVQRRQLGLGVFTALD